MEQVTINGKKYPVHFGLSQIVKGGRERGYSTLNELTEHLSKVAKTDLQAVEDIGYFIAKGIERGCLKQGVENDLDEDDIIDLMISDPDTFENLLNVFMKTFESAPGAEEKKNQTAAKKKKSPGRG